MSLVKVFFLALFPHEKECDVGLALGVGTGPRVEPIHPGSSCGHLGRWRRRLDPHRLRAWAVLEEAAVGPRAVAPAVGTPLTAARRLLGGGSGGYRLCDPSATSSSSLRRTCGWCLSSILRQSGGSCRYSTETGRRHPCHGAVADSLGPIAIEIPQLQFIDHVLVAQV